MNSTPSLAPVADTEAGLTGWAERGWLPDAALRAGIRRLCAQRLAEESSGSMEEQAQRVSRRIAELAGSPLALHVDAANRQHYEVPAEFFSLVLGPQRKYSCCLYPPAATTLAEAEHHALAETVSHAAIEDGMSILELGCGWGSLSLYLAEKFPNSLITSVSN